MLDAQRERDVLDVHQHVEEQVVEGGDGGLAAAVGRLVEVGHEPGGRAGGVRAGHVAVEPVEVAAGAQAREEDRAGAGRTRGERDVRDHGADAPLGWPTRASATVAVGHSVFGAVTITSATVSPVSGGSAAGTSWMIAQRSRRVRGVLVARKPG